MYIFIDESGSFAKANKRGSWNVVAAYMTPETELMRMRYALSELKRVAGVDQEKEVKLRDLSEIHYATFLAYLSQLEGVLFVAATDAAKSGISDIVQHRNNQAASITKHVHLMQHESGKRAVLELSDKVQRLSPQLYIQLQCQVRLMYSVIRLGVLYFVQRIPHELNSFRWRIDQKNARRTEYEKAFETIAPGLLQSISLEEPMMMLNGADYSAFKRFEYAKGEAPDHLMTTYGIDIDVSDSANIGKLVHEDLKFVDSEKEAGVQVADLLASGMRRCLRMGFHNNIRIARFLGALLVSGEMQSPPLQLLAFTREDRAATRETTSLVRNLSACSRAMMVQ